MSIASSGISMKASIQGPCYEPQISTIVDGDLLERTKENIVPAREGRSAVALSQVFSAPRAERQRELVSSHAYFKQLILEAKDVDPIDGDPLEPYCQYVKWINDNYPSGSSSESGLLTVLEEATRTFCDSPRYKNESKYVHLWMEYANLVEQTERVYAFMLANDIGSNWPHLYQEYALVLERNGNRSKADGLYRLGIARKVLGVERIKASYKDFQARCLVSPAGAEPAVPPPPTRLVLGGREVLGARRGVAAAPLGSSQQVRSSASTQTSRSNVGKIAVHVDGDVRSVDIETSEWPYLETRSESIKENVPSKSLRSGPLHQKAFTPTTPKIEILRDQGTTATSRTPSTVQSPDQALRPRGTGADQDLARNPFKNYSRSVAFDFDLPEIPGSSPTLSTSLQGVKTTYTVPIAPADELMTSRFSVPSEPTGPRPHRRPISVSAAGPKPKPSLPAPIPGKKPEIPGFATSQVWLDGEEYDRRESQARALGLLKKKWPLPPIEEFDVPLKDAASSAPGHPRKSLSKRRQSNANPVTTSPTTNTKAALNDVFSMFNTSGGDEEADDFEPLHHQGMPGSGMEMPASSSRDTPFTPARIPQSGKIPIWASDERVQTSCLPRSQSMPSNSLSVAFPSDHNLAPTASSSEATGLAKFAVLQDNGAPRLPSAAMKGVSKTNKSDPAVLEASTVAGPFPNVELSVHLPLKANQKIPVFTDSLESKFVSSDNPSARVPHASVDPPLLVKLSEATDHDKPLGVADGSSPNAVFVADSSASGSITPGNSEGLEDVFGPTVTISEPAGSLVSSQYADTSIGPTSANVARYDEINEDVDYAEHDDQDHEILPRSYEVHRGVAIMTPITERTMEFGSNTRLLAGLSQRRTLGGTPTKDGVVPEGLEVLKAKGVSGSSQDAAQELEAPGPIDPFHPDNIARYISEVWGSLSIECYHDLETEESNFGDVFEKHIKRINRSSRLGQSVSEAPSPLQVVLGHTSYEVFDKLGEGGFGAVYLARDPVIAEMVDEGSEDDTVPQPGSELVALKVVRPAMQWEWVILQIIRESVPRICEAIIRPRDLYHFKNESILVLDYSSQGTLLEAVNHAPQIGIHSQDTFAFDELLVMFFTIELLRLLGHLHSQHFIHGDLKIDNCMLRLADPAVSTLSAVYDPSGAGGWCDRGIKLIDFGRAIDVNAYELGTSFIANWPADARDCIEIREDRPWTYQTDYAGAAGVIYCMMFGKYIQTSIDSNSAGSQPRYRITPSLKRYWQVDLWTRLFDLLLNSSSIHPNGQLPLLEEIETLQWDMEQWLIANCERKGKSLKLMLSKLYSFCRSHDVGQKL